jgi:UDP-glucose 4-epimerase
MTHSVLVTGGAGYIGSHIVVELAAAGLHPLIADNFATSSTAVLPRLRRITDDPVPCITCDVRDRGAMKRLFAEHAISAVVHCAGLKAVGEGEARPLEYYDNNVGGAVTLLEAMAEAGVKSLVFSSSATVYGQPDANPVTEDAPSRATSVYGRTKRMVEQILEDLVSSDAQWRIAVLRYFNPAGAHSSGEIGEAPSAAPNNLVPLLAQAAATESPAIDVFGDDWGTADGTGVRDYVHVMDLANGHVAAMAHLARSPGLTTLNLGSGRGHSVLEVVAAFEHACGRPITRRMGLRRPGDVAIYYADTSRAQRVLGWTAMRDLDAICADAWRWQTSGNR